MKNRQTLRKLIFQNFFWSNIIGVLLILLAPLIILNFFFFIQYVTLYNVVEQNITTNSQIFVYASENGLASATFTLEDYIATQNEASQVCTVKDVKLLHNGINVDYNDDCPSTFYTLSKSIIEQSYLYYVLTITVILGVYLLLTWLRMKNIEKRIVESFNRANSEIKNIKQLTIVDKASASEPIEEFKFMLEEIEKVTKQISSYNFDKNELISILTHELKTPIATINAAIQLNELGIDEYQEVAYCNKLILKETHKINQAIEYALILYASIGDDNDRTKHFDLAILIEQLVEELNRDQRFINMDIISGQLIDNNYQTTHIILKETIKNALNITNEEGIYIDCKFKEFTLSFTIDQKYENEAYRNIKFTESACRNLNISFKFLLEQGYCQIKFSF